MLNDFSQIDNDLGLNIIYFLQHGHWRVNEHSLQMEKIWFYNSEPSIDIQEYNSFAKNTTNTFIFTIIPDNNHVAGNYRLPLQLRLSVRMVIILLISPEINQT